MRNTACLLVSCPDRKGLVTAIANFLYSHNANILHADQHQDKVAGLFLMRVEWDLAGFELGIHRFEEAFAPIAAQHQMTWRLSLSSVKPRLTEEPEGEDMLFFALISLVLSKSERGWNGFLEKQLPARGHSPAAEVPLGR